MDERIQDLQLFEAYLQRRAPGRRTATDYLCDIRQFMTACPKPWTEVTVQDIDAFLDQQRQLGLSVATLRRRGYALKVFFDFLAEETGNLAWPNPVRLKRHIAKPTKRLPRDLSDEHLELLGNAITNPRDQAWFVLMLRAGLRVGEVVILTLSCLLSPATLEQPARLRVFGKGQKERIVLLSAEPFAILQQWLRLRPASPYDQIFLNERGEPLTANGIEWLLHRYGQTIGLAVTPHQLRHSFARQLVEGGMPLPSLSKLLGHAQLNTTEIYTAGADPKLAEAYQQAMSQLGQTHEPEPWPIAPTVPAPQPESVLFVTATLPDWDKWATELPTGLRQVSLAFVQRRLANWKPSRQATNARKSLGYFARFWRWQLQQRPIAAPSELRYADFLAFQQAQLTKGIKPTSINRQFDDLRALLRELQEQDIAIDPAVFRLRDLVQPQRLPRYLPEPDIRRLESYVHARLATADGLIRLENACFFMLAHTGMRAGECVELLIQDIDWAGQRVLIREGKGRRDRMVYLSDTLQQAMRLYLATSQPTGALFVRPDNGRPLTYSWLAECIKALGQAVNVTVTPHQLRHTFATRLLNVGLKESTIQKLLGHQHLSTTMIYARISDTTVEADYRQAMSKIEGRITNS